MKPSGPGLFVCWKIFNHSFNFITCDWSVHIFYFFLVHSWKVAPFLEFVHFFQFVRFIGRVACSSLLRCFVFLWSVVTPFSFLILLIWVHSFFFLMSLAKGLSILFMFSKNQLLVLLIFPIVFFVSISFISAVIFTISFLLLILGFVYSSFSSSFRCKVSLFIWDFSCFLR